MILLKPNSPCVANYTTNMQINHEYCDIFNHIVWVRIVGRRLLLTEHQGYRSTIFHLKWITSMTSCAVPLAVKEKLNYR